MKSNFKVTFKEVNKSLSIFAPDHARATEWALMQLKQWNLRGTDFDVEEISEPVVPKENPRKRKKGKK